MLLSDQELFWKRNLFFIWLSQFLSLAAFNFCIPFLAIYLQTSGMVSPTEVLKWSGILIACTPISMMIFSPAWGILGDRYGRKIMLIRANMGGAISLYLMGLAGSVESLMFLRLLQGAFAGTVPASQTLVVSTTPERHQGFAIGAIMAAVNAGNTAGFFLGGLCARYYGPRMSFQISGLMLFISAVLVIFTVRDNFTPVSKSSLSSTNPRSSTLNIFNMPFVLFILFTILYSAFVFTFDSSFFSLFTKHIFETSRGVAGVLSESEIASKTYEITGYISGFASITAMAGSVLSGIILDKRLPKLFWCITCIFGGISCIYMALSSGIFELAFTRSLMMFFISGISSAITVWLGKVSDKEHTGTVFGWAVTARSIGWILAPLASAPLAHYFGWRITLIIAGILHILMFPLLYYIQHKISFLRSDTFTKCS